MSSEGVVVDRISDSLVFEEVVMLAGFSQYYCSISDLHWLRVSEATYMRS